jgi:hypothetical protein
MELYQFMIVCAQVSSSLLYMWRQSQSAHCRYTLQWRRGAWQAVWARGLQYSSSSEKLIHTKWMSAVLHRVHILSPLTLCWLVSFRRRSQSLFLRGVLKFTLRLTSIFSCHGNFIFFCGISLFKGCIYHYIQKRPKNKKYCNGRDLLSFDCSCKVWEISRG